MEGTNQETYKESKVVRLLDDVKEMSSKLSEVGRNIVFAIIAGSWVLYNKYDCSGSMSYLKWSLILAFIYLLIDLLYYGITMLVYDYFLDINTEKSTVDIRYKKKMLKRQKTWRKTFIFLTGIKTLLLFGSIFCILYVIR